MGALMAELTASVKHAATARNKDRSITDAPSLMTNSGSHSRDFAASVGFKFPVERNRLPSQAAHRCGLDRHSLAQLQRGHLVLSAGLETGLNVKQPLAAPETKQHAAFLGTNEQHGFVVEVDEVTPLHDFFQRCGTTHAFAQRFDTFAAPSAKCSDVRVGGSPAGLVFFTPSP